MSVLAVAALLLTGCIPGTDKATENATPTTADEENIGSIDENLRDFYTQEVTWEPCEDNKFSCTKVKVPLDYQNPDGRSIELALIKKDASGPNKLGSLLINPGGPGGSGYDAVLESIFGLSTAESRAKYDMVGFDPRGVKRSAPVKCLDAEEMDAYRANDSEPSEESSGITSFRENVSKFAQACEQNSDGVLAFVDTKSAAQDMDIIRAILNQKQLNYLGFSYGTLLGATYADTFPDKVGKFVLDGAVDPALTSAELTMGQAQGFERTLRAYVESCLQSDSCPLSGSVDSGITQIQEMITDAGQNPKEASDGRKVNDAYFVSGLIVPLYSEGNWSALTMALAAWANDSNPDLLLKFADLNADREEDGSYSGNSNEAFTAINCLDYPADASDEQMEAEREKLIEASPTLGAALAYGDATCQQWPVKSKRTPGPTKAEGAGPILVVGTTGDPATPYDWSVSLADQLSSGELLTYEGEGHTAYGRANKCLNESVDNYLVNGQDIEPNKRC